MKQTVRKPIYPAYTLHDMRIINIETDGDRLRLCPQSGMVRTTPPYDQIEGYVEFHGVQWDFCYAYVLEHHGNVGRFHGEKMTLQDFIYRFRPLGFSVMDEVYGYNQTKYWGYLSYQREVFECILEIQHEGDMVFTETGPHPA